MIAPDHERQRLLELLHRKGLPPRWEPTPAEIAAECLRIQSRWSPQERQRRIVGGLRVEPVAVDEVAMADVVANLE